MTEGEKKEISRIHTRRALALDEADTPDFKPITEATARELGSSSLHTSTRRERKANGQPYNSFTPPVSMATWEADAYRNRPWEQRNDIDTQIAPENRP